MLGHIDQIFWKRYADELDRKPESPAMACFAGMLQVGVMFFIFFVALLVPVSRIGMIGVNLLSGTPALTLTARTIWFVAVAMSSAIISMFILVRRYWKYRLTPELARPYFERVDRIQMAFTWAGITVVALGLLAGMCKLFL